MDNRIKDRILRLTEVCDVTGLSRSTIYAWISEGSFPRYIRLGGKSVGWLLSDINAWIEKCVAATSAAEKSQKGE